MRLIDADALLDKLADKWNIPDDWDGGIAQPCEDAFGAIEDAPTISPDSLRPKGWWEWDTEDVYICANCNTKNHVKEVMGQPAWDFCPNCGANMTGE